MTNYNNHTNNVFKNVVIVSTHHQTDTNDFDVNLESTVTL